MDAASHSERSNKLGAQNFCPWKRIKLTGPNAIKLDLSPNKKFHPVTHVDPSKAAHVSKGTLQTYKQK